MGIGFAIPSNLAKPIVNQLAEFGKTRRGWLGVKIQTVTDEIADGLGLKDVHGALVASVTPGGPAEKGNIKAGDVIVQIGEHKVNDVQGYMQVLGKFNKGDATKVKVKRGAEELVFDIVF